jgi:putative MATE family efflux protein
MVVQVATILLNIVLSPVMIAGWGTGVPLGAAGAGWASTIAVAGGTVLLTVYFLKLEHYVGFDTKEWMPDPRSWGRLLNIGIPSGGEFAFMSLYSAIVYWIIKDFGASAQAGFGIAGRVMQSVFLPAMAIAFAAAPIAGQNYGARLPARVKETFKTCLIACVGIMLVLAFFVHWQGGAMIAYFSKDPAAVAFGSQFLSIISWNFAAMGVVFTCSSLFQGLGNTWPSLISMATRVVTFAVPAIWISSKPGFDVLDIWHLSVATVLFQACLSLTLLYFQFRSRLGATAGLAQAARA